MEWGLLFVVDEGATDELAGYMIACGGPGWSLPIGENLAGASVPISDGEFEIDNEDVLVTGQFTDAMTIEGTLEAKSQTATDCGLPESAEWTAECGQKTGVQFLSVEGEEIEISDEPCTEP